MHVCLQFDRYQFSIDIAIDQLNLRMSTHYNTCIEYMHAQSAAAIDIIAFTRVQMFDHDHASQHMKTHTHTHTYNERVYTVTHLDLDSHS